MKRLTSLYVDELNDAFVCCYCYNNYMMTMLSMYSEIIKRNQSVMPNIKEAWKAACGRRLSDRLQVPFHLQKVTTLVLI